MNWKDIVERAIWTFIQGALGTIAVVPILTDVEALEALAVAALTGGVSSILSFLKTLSQERLAVFDTRAELGG